MEDIRGSFSAFDIPGGREASTSDPGGRGDYQDKCLSSNFAGSVYPTQCSGSIHHQWQRMSNGELRDAGTHPCLSANTADVYLANVSSIAAHMWDFRPA